ncbi:Hg(II)-responsive transcriptional regulator [Hydrogenophaga sp. RAC07]|uniref:Hg(II)-responsive transcriptional regulator n=1 Tax=Hydrogenophaga sp. RAC07 TaxID=1842537 RepID=UPI00083D2B14|nr:Hg(II)-responsive transcriptional regulator [Hydrogenophaga sp. RAC07]AOF84085.1 Hg(II)-responsive transcriptional regulator [Hydrogenophaga sp. RAC07]
MNLHNDHLTIGEFGALAGVNVETIRFYQRKTLLSEPPRQAGSIRRYGAADVERLRFIKSAQSVGFSLDEVGELLRLEDGAQCKQASALAEAKLVEIRRKLAELARMELALSGLVKACRVGRGKVACPLIASFHAPTETSSSE